MEKARILTYTKEEVQIVYASEGYNDVFTSNGYTAIDISTKEIEGVLQKTSLRRSYYFFVFSKNIFPNTNSAQKPVAVYGVKGGIRTGRSKIYIETFACGKEDLKEDGFFNHVIKAPYITEEDAIRPNTQDELKSIVNQISYRHVAANKTKHLNFTYSAKRVLTRILREYDSVESRTNIVLFLNDAENNSLPFLETMYKFFPFELRNKLGFMTNVEVRDINVINSSIPSIVFTIMDSSLKNSLDYDELDALYIDAENPYYNFLKKESENEYDYYKFMDLLDKVEKQLKSGADAKKQFDDAESQTMKKKKSVNGLSCYKEIATNFIEQRTMSNKDKRQIELPNFERRSTEQIISGEDLEDRDESPNDKKDKISEFEGTNNKQNRNTRENQKYTTEGEREEEEIGKVGKAETEDINGCHEGNIGSTKKKSEDKGQKNQDDGDGHGIDSHRENNNDSNAKNSKESENQEDIIMISRKKIYLLSSLGIIIVIISLMAAIHYWTALNEIKTAQNEIIHKLDAINSMIEGRGNEINALEDSAADERSSEGIDMNNGSLDIHYSANGVEDGYLDTGLQQRSAFENNQASSEQSSTSGNNQSKEQETDDD